MRGVPSAEWGQLVDGVPVITQPTHWYRPESLLGVADGAAVTTWPDSGSGGADLTQAFAGFRPLCRVNKWRGLPGLEFDGIDDVMPSVAGLGPYSPPFTVLVVCGTTGAGGQVPWAGKNASSHPQIRFDTAALQGANGAGITTPFDPASGVAQIVVYESDLSPAATSKIYGGNRCGTTTGISGSFTVDRMFVGDNGLSASPFGGLVIEVAFWAEPAFTLAQRYGLRKYGPDGLGV